MTSDLVDTLVPAARMPVDDEPVTEGYGKRGTFTVVGSDYQPAVGNSGLTLNSRIPLGSTATEFRHNRFVVTINNKRNVIPVWGSSNRMKLALPAGEGGTEALLEIRRDGNVVGSVTVYYLGKVSNAAWQTDPATGRRFGTIVGTGLSRTQNWRLVSPDGEGVLELPFAPTPADLEEAPEGGVFVVRDSQALVELPADVPGRAGVWSLAFDPVEGAAFAPLSPASKLDVTYTAPRVARLSGSGVSTKGGTELVVHGSNLGSIRPSRPDAVSLRSDDGGVDVPCRVISARQTGMTIVVPELDAGVYRVVLRTGMGVTDDGMPREGLVAVDPVPGRSSSDVVLGIGGTVVVHTTDLGSSQPEMTMKKVSARLGRRPLPLKWLSETSVQVNLPPGVPGTTADIEILRHGIPSPPVPVKYAAAITGSTRIAVPTEGGTIRFTGVGLSGSWRLHPVAAGVSLAQDVVLDSFVADERGRSITLDLPPAPQGVYEVRFSPDQAAFPGAVSVFTSKSVVSYNDFG